MEAWIPFAGLGLCLCGALVLAFADAWLSRSILIYMDAVETNLGKLVEAIRSSGTDFTVTGVDLKRDRGQDRARLLKLAGWLALILGFGLQIAAALIAKRAA
jgi:hypothetical protein